VIILSEEGNTTKINTGDLKEGVQNIGPEIRSYLRVLKLARKPTRKEFFMIAKVAAAGIIAIGLFGFFVYFVMDILPKMV